MCSAVFVNVYIYIHMCIYAKVFRGVYIHISELMEEKFQKMFLKPQFSKAKNAGRSRKAQNFRLRRSKVMKTLLIIG